MSKTTIEWANFSFNPWIGCTKVSPGCAHCYAEARDQRFSGGAHWGKGAPRQRTSAANWKQPLKWNRDAFHFVQCECGWRGDWRKDALMAMINRQMVAQCPSCTKTGTMKPVRPRVFCASLADWLDDEVPIEWLADLLKLIHDTPNLDWLLLTKRPQNWRSRIEAALAYTEGVTGDWPSREPNTEFGEWLNEWTRTDGCGYPKNVQIGTTTENQPMADERITHLVQIPARVRFLSVEPMLGPVRLDHSETMQFCNSCLAVTPTSELPGGTDFQCGKCGDPRTRERSFLEAGIHWVICGGESGPGARPMHPQWARSLRDQCAAAGVPFFFKQWGEWIPCDQGDCDTHEGPRAELRHDGTLFGVYEPTTSCCSNCNAIDVTRVGKKAAGRLLDGAEWSQFPDKEVD